MQKLLWQNGQECVCPFLKNNCFGATFFPIVVVASVLSDSLWPHGLLGLSSVHGPPGSPLSMGFPRQEYWSGLPFPSPVDLGLEPPYLLHCRWILYHWATWDSHFLPHWTVNSKRRDTLSALLSTKPSICIPGDHLDDQVINRCQNILYRNTGILYTHTPFIF